MRHFLLAFATISLFGEDAPKPTPKITDAQIIQFLKARADNAEAQTQALKTQVALQSVIEAMQKVCPIMLDASGLPACVPTPPPPSK